MQLNLDFLYAHRLAKLRCGVQWIDNYSKIMPYAFPSTSTSLLSKCLWTVTGYLVSTIPNPPSLRILGDFAAMPLELINPGIEEIFLNLYDTFEKEDHFLFYDESVSKMIRCVPLRPDNKADVKPPIFYPDRLLGVNISSNPGLIHVLRAVFNETADRSRYRVLVSDCNVFLRAMKVVLNVLFGCILFIFD